MRVQIALTVAEAKRLIARAVILLPEVRAALEHSRILLKGGTTVSAVAEELSGIPLRISGRISERGTVASGLTSLEHPHSIVIEGGQWENIDQTIVDVSEKLRASDVAIVGGNALDIHGTAAMMAGASGGGNPGRALSGMHTQGAKVIIPIGLEKLIPGTIQDAVRAAGRDQDLSYGMSVGLIPLVGRVVTEKEAAEIVADVQCTVIGRGGIAGAEGATVMAVSGSESAVRDLLQVVEAVKGATISGEPDSLSECDGTTARCRAHKACIYKGGRRKDPLRQLVTVPDDDTN